MFHEEELALIEKTCAAEPAVAGLILLGSVNRHDHDELSDLDLVCIMRNPSELPLLEEHLVAVHGNRVRLNCILESPKKLVIYIDDALRKIEIFLMTSLDDIIQYLIEEDFSCSVLLDKYGGISKQLNDLKEHYAVSRHTTKEDIVNGEIDKILYGFEAFSLANKRGDAYKAYFEYNLILHRLTRLIHVSRNKTRDLHLPPWILSNAYWSTAKMAEFQALQGCMDCADQNALKKRFLEFFAALLGDLNASVHLKRPVGLILSFLESVCKRDARVVESPSRRN
ncbi:MAG: hypothetical protein GYA24_03945 [Candidatus Lokiarchaeota archaeon]|nr:hypothetical protein [Candidatus Lokiarchaeota archaeon]